MELTPMHKRVIALDVHQAKITACAVVEHDDGRVDVNVAPAEFERRWRAGVNWRDQAPAPEKPRVTHRRSVSGSSRATEPPVRG